MSFCCYSTIMVVSVDQRSYQKVKSAFHQFYSNVYYLVTDFFKNNFVFNTYHLQSILLQYHLRSKHGLNADMKLQKLMINYVRDRYTIYVIKTVFSCFLCFTDTNRLVIGS